MAFADEAALLGPLAGTIDAQLRQNWRAGEEDGWFVLRNPNGDNEEQALVITAGPPPEGGRMTSVNVSLNAQDDTASVGIFIQNRQANSSCLMEITAKAAANLFCYTNDKYEPIATVEGAAKLDGSDVIEMAEVQGAARFFVNGQTIGDVEGKPALGADIGLMAYDRATFGIAGFQIADLEPQSGGGEAQGAVTAALQRDHGLDRAFAEAVEADDQCAVAILERARNDFSGRGRSAVDQYDNRHASEIVAAAGVVALNIFRLTAARGDHFAAIEKSV